MTAHLGFLLLKAPMDPYIHSSDEVQSFRLSDELFAIPPSPLRDYRGPYLRSTLRLCSTLQLRSTFRLPSQLHLLSPLYLLSYPHLLSLQHPQYLLHLLSLLYLKYLASSVSYMANHRSFNHPPSQSIADVSYCRSILILYLTCHIPHMPFHPYGSSPISLFTHTSLHSYASSPSSITCLRILPYSVSSVISSTSFCWSKGDMNDIWKQEREQEWE